MTFRCPRCGETFAVKPPSGTCPNCDAALVVEPDPQAAEQRGEQQGHQPPRRRR